MRSNGVKYMQREINLPPRKIATLALTTWGWQKQLTFGGGVKSSPTARGPTSWESTPPKMFPQPFRSPHNLHQSQESTHQTAFMHFSFSKLPGRGHDPPRAAVQYSRCRYFKRHHLAVCHRVRDAVLEPLQQIVAGELRLEGPVDIDGRVHLQQLMVFEDLQELVGDMGPLRTVGIPGVKNTSNRHMVTLRQDILKKNCVTVLRLHSPCSMWCVKFSGAGCFHINRSQKKDHKKCKKNQAANFFRTFPGMHTFLLARRKVHLQKILEPQNPHLGPNFT